MNDPDVDVAIVGGGHNGLIAAAYLARAGLKVIVLEKLNVMGGAAISTEAFEGLSARLSRYSYLVSLLPKAIIDDLDLSIELAPRRYSSYTPDPFGTAGLLIDKQDAAATRESFASVGAERDYDSWQRFYAKTEQLARALFPTVLRPLQRRAEVARLVDAEVWTDLIETPICETVRREFDSDLVRGVVMTDALIGTFAPNDDPTLEANRCFLYHVIGNETGEWNIPVGGMGAVTDSMREAAIRFGAQLVTGAEVTGVSTARDVTFVRDGEVCKVRARYVLANVSRHELHRLLGEPAPAPVQGAQVKVNMLLRRLPRLKSGADARAAFGGTFHINENFTQLQQAFEAGASGEIPTPLPCEIYCHSLTDPSILGPELHASGVQTLTVFALHTPHSILDGKGLAEMRDALQRSVIVSLNSVLAEDIRELLLLDASGNPCIETKTTADLEAALGLPGGNIFHGPLSWPFAEDDEDLSAPELAWGVASGFEGIYFCGSTARRGGAVSGIGGHNAAMAIMERDAIHNLRH